ncbi:pseudouridine synthase [Aureibacter tunicatorum]|uniref:Pseudouridine synthase n=1 Tax=Aureibacter tunicatorum TaxID=866807 RepID=A0AAE3XMY3_9BACT|nr:pseudouridine synthase [Aureibacter tunicatorum]MDR6239912.1 23S rRNA pseudouridine2457 synthase [Aureibacter tunicatorum]BDD04387.1 pseudouridine synthase [Aureibacter tunicatorum]
MKENFEVKNKPHKHFKIYKPYGYLSQFVPETRKNKKLLGELHDFPDNTMAVGRLDHDSEGLLLLTTDGMFSFDLRQKHVEKEYYVQVDGLIDDKAIELMQKGVEIGVKGKKYTTLPSKVRMLDKEPELPSRGRNIRDSRHGPTSWISVVVTEGKNRQVRKMTAAVGFPTLRLVRVRVGDFVLGQMDVGEVIEIA